MVIIAGLDSDSPAMISSDNIQQIISWLTNKPKPIKKK